MSQRCACGCGKAVRPGRKWRSGHNARGESLRASFLSRVDRTDLCWLWRGATDSNGYGVLNRDGHRRMAHRVAYELFVGPIPEGLEIDHLCRNRPCVNPDHLEPVERRTNILRGNGWSGRHSRKERCPQGHPYDAANTYIDRAGSRICRECRRAHARAAYWRRKKVAA